MAHWLDELERDLSARSKARLLRKLNAITASGPTVQRGSDQLVNLASNDYLGLTQHPTLKQAAIDAINEHGTGSGASKLVSGHTPQCQATEQAFAQFKHAEAALFFPTGYMANFGVLTALTNKEDVIFIDKLTHASLIDAAHASDATLRVFPHRHVDRLEALLKRNAQARRRLIVTDSVFSMDGDVADLVTLCDLAEQYNAILVVDEAHGTGVLGPTRAGLCELQKVTDRVDIVISTAGKALGSLGGIVTAKQPVIETLVNHARSLIYTTAPPPAQVATLHAAVNLLQTDPQPRQRLAALSQQVRQAVIELGFKLPESNVATPIIPLIVGQPDRALALSAYLAQAGFFAPAIRPPTVAPDASRVRLSLRADLTDAHIADLLEVLAKWEG